MARRRRRCRWRGCGALWRGDGGRLAWLGGLRAGLWQRRRWLADRPRLGCFIGTEVLQHATKLGEGIVTLAITAADRFFVFEIALGAVFGEPDLAAPRSLTCRLLLRRELAAFARFFLLLDQIPKPAEEAHDDDEQQEDDLSPVKVLAHRRGGRG